MSLISIRDLTFSYPGGWEEVFTGLNLELDTAWRLGLVGRNGRGKTTLLRLLSGALTPGGGSVSLPEPVSYFPFPLHWDDTPALEALERRFPDLEEWRLFRELNLLETDPELLYRPLATLSGGERIKLQLAALFQQPERYLLIDEPTDHLDLAGRAAVSAYLAQKPGFLLVSHDRAFLDGCTDHILSFNKTGPELIRGTFSTWWAEKEDRDRREAAENQRLKGEIRRLKESARRTGQWAEQVEASKYGSRNSGLRPDRGFLGHKSAKMMKRSKAAERRQERALAEKEGLLKDLEHTAPLLLRPLEHPKDRLLEVRDFCPDYGAGPVGSPISFTLRRGERLALTGPNGCGKSSLLKAVLGREIPHTGALALASGAVVSYVPQDTGGLKGSFARFAQESGVDLTRLLTLLRKLDVPRAQFEQDLAALSEGQKKKVLLARSLCQSAHLYLWDEPLNYVDVFSRMQIEALLRETDATLLLVEHDRAFLQAVGARVLTL